MTPLVSLLIDPFNFYNFFNLFNHYSLSNRLPNKIQKTDTIYLYFL